MGKLVVTEFMSLDGVVEDPAGEWAAQFDQGVEAGEFKLKETVDSECLLLGRVTYDEFSQSWPQEQGEFADLFSALPKYVMSSTLQNPSWKNTTVLSGDLAAEVTALKTVRRATWSCTAAQRSSMRCSKRTSSTNFGSWSSRFSSAAGATCSATPARRLHCSLSPPRRRDRTACSC